MDDNKCACENECCVGCVPPDEGCATVSTYYDTLDYGDGYDDGYDDGFMAGTEAIRTFVNTVRTGVAVVVGGVIGVLVAKALRKN